MNNDSIGPIARLKEKLQQLPGIGARSAERLAFHILRGTKEEAACMASAITSVKESIFHCSVCYNLTESDPCSICADPARD